MLCNHNCFSGQSIRIQMLEILADKEKVKRFPMTDPQKSVKFKVQSKLKE